MSNSVRSQSINFKQELRLSVFSFHFPILISFLFADNGWQNFPTVKRIKYKQLSNYVAILVNRNHYLVFDTFGNTVEEVKLFRNEYLRRANRLESKSFIFHLWLILIFLSFNATTQIRFPLIGDITRQGDSLFLSNFCIDKGSVAPKDCYKIRI